MTSGHSQHGDAMRCTLAFLTLLTAWTTLVGVDSLLAGQAAILGRVLSIDGKRAEVVVALVGDQAQGEETAADQAIHVVSPPDGLPPRLREGDIVRIWGEYSTSDPSLFNATHLGYGQGCSDPTGVRSRIGRSRGMGHGNGKGGRR